MTTLTEALGTDGQLCGEEMPDITTPRPTCILPVGHESRVHRSAPPVHVWALMYETGSEESCKDCTHPWTAHSRKYGCEMDWRYDKDGIAAQDGCMCLLAHLTLSAGEDL